MMKPMTGDEFRRMIEVAQKKQDIDELRKDSQIQIAALFNQERKIAMIDSMNQFYAYQCGNGPRPQIMPSEAFNPECGTREPNMYYIFKELRKGMPWEIRLDYLVTPLALTRTVFELADKYFPSPEVSGGSISVERLINLLARPVCRPELSDEEQKEKRQQYMKDLDECKSDLYDLYKAISVYFSGLEDPTKNPFVKKVNEISVDTKKVRAKVCGKEPQLSAFAKKRAYDIWILYRRSSEVAAMKNRPSKISYADVFAYCKRELVNLGISDAKTFKKAVRAYKKSLKKA